MTSSNKGSQNATEKLGNQIGKIAKITPIRGDRGVQLPNGVLRGVLAGCYFFIRILDSKHTDRQTVKIGNGPLDLKFGTRPNSRTANPKMIVPDP